MGVMGWRRGGKVPAWSLEYSSVRAWRRCCCSAMVEDVKLISKLEVYMVVSCAPDIACGLRDKYHLDEIETGRECTVPK